MTTTQTSLLAGVSAAPGWEWVHLERDEDEEAALAAPSRVQWSGTVGEADVIATWELGPDGIECIGLQVSGPVRAELLRTLGLDGQGRLAVESLAVGRRSPRTRAEAGLPEGPGLSDLSADVFFADDIVEPADPKRARRAASLLPDGRGARPVPADDIAQAAEIYNRARSAPVDAVATALGLTPRTASRRIAQARKAGLIEPAVKRGGDLSDAELQVVASVYAGDPGAPVAAVAKHLGKSKRTAARVIAQARERGLIPPLEQGSN